MDGGRDVKWVRGRLCQCTGSVCGAPSAERAVGMDPGDGQDEVSGRCTAQEPIHYSADVLHVLHSAYISFERTIRGTLGPLGIRRQPNH